MFPGECMIHRRPLSVGEAKSRIEEGVVPCFNPGHTATINLMRQRFGFDIPAPDGAYQVNLEKGDCLIVMSIRGLPRLTDRHEYTQDEIDNADISFGIYEIK